MLFRLPVILCADDDDAICFDCEDKEVAHASFLRAHRHSRPESIQVDGLQDFAAAVRQYVPQDLPSQAWY